MKQRIISDSNGNRYMIDEQKDSQGTYLEVSEIVSMEGKDTPKYLCDVGLDFNADDKDIIDDIDDIKSKFVTD